MSELPRLKPLHVFDHQAVNRLVVDLNNILARMSVSLPAGAASKKDLSGYVRTVDLPGLIQTFIDNSVSSETTQGSSMLSGAVGSSNPTTGPGSPSQQDAQAAVIAAEPLNPPPFIATTSSIGTTDSSTPRFALEDHTHGGALDFRQVFMAPTGRRTSKHPVQGTFGDSGNVAQISVDQEGRVTSVVNVGIVASSSDLLIRHSLGLVPKGEKTTKQPVQGTYGSSSLTPIITVDRLGRIQSITTTATTPSATDLAYRRSFFAALGDKSSKRPTQGTFGSASAVPVITVDRLGRVTALTTAAINTGATFRVAPFAPKGWRSSIRPVAGVYGSSVLALSTITLDSDGRVTGITTTAGDVDDFDPYHWWGEQTLVELSTNIQVVNITASTQGTPSGPTVNSTGAFADYASNGAATNNRAGWGSSNACVEAVLNPVMVSTARTSADLTNQRILVGFTSNPGATNNTDTPGGAGLSVAEFRYSSVAGDTTWQAVTADASSQQVQNTGVAVSASTTYRFRIEVTDGVNCKFYINNILVQTNTLHLPVSATQMNVISYLYNTATASRTFSQAKLYARHRVP